MNRWARNGLQLSLILVLGALGLSAPGAASAVDITVFGPKKYLRGTGAPERVTDTFDAQKYHATLELTNGAPEGSDQCTSAIITLNGTKLLGPDSFKKAMFNLKLSVELTEENTFSVELRGKPGSYINVRILQEDSPSDPFHEDLPSLGRPDAALTNLEVSPDRSKPGEAVTLKATIANFRFAESEPCSLRFLVDEVEVATFAVERLGGGVEKDLSTLWYPQVPGRHQVKAELVLPHDTIDLNLNNNSKTAVARVSGEATPIPELECTKVELDPPFPIAGQSSQVTVHLRNPGFVQLDDLLLGFSVDERIVSDPIMISLAEGQSSTVHFTWPDLTPGMHIVRVQAALPDSASVPLLQANFGWTVVVPEASPSGTMLRAAAFGTVAADDILPSLAELGQWASMGPSIIEGKFSKYFGLTQNGRMTTIARLPLYGIIYAGSWHGGLWKSTDEGFHWTPLTDTEQDNRVWSVAVDGFHEKIVYYVGYSEGQTRSTIYKSINGGDSWNVFISWPGNDIQQLVAQAVGVDHSEVVLYAATSDGLKRLRSNNPDAITSQPADWQTILPGMINEIAVHPPDPNNVFAVRLYKHTWQDTQGKQGVSWFPETIFHTTQGLHVTGQPDWEKSFDARGLAANQITVGICQAHPQIVYAVVRLPDNGDKRILDIYRSSDGGMSWEYQFRNSSEENTIYTLFVRVHPSNPDIIYYGGVYLHKSMKTFCGWGTFTVPDIHADQHDLAFGQAGIDYFIVGDGGVYYGFVEQDSGFDTVYSRNYDLRTALLWDFDVSLTAPNLMIAGTQDNGTIEYVGTEEDPVWRVYRGGDGLYSLIAPSNNSVMYSQYLLLGDTVQSQDWGLHWDSKAMDGLEETDGQLNLETKFITVDPANEFHILAQGAKVQESWTGGDKWSEPDNFAALRSSSSSAIEGDIARMIFKDSGSNYFAGTGKGQIWFSDPPQWPIMIDQRKYARVRRMAISHGVNQFLYVLNDTAVPQERVLKIWYDGTKWQSTPIADKLPQTYLISTKSIFFNCIAVDPVDENIVYLGTDKGVYRGQGTLVGWTWAPYNKNLPLVTVNDLLSIPSTKELRAATYGRGFWTVLVTPPSIAKITHPSPEETVYDSQMITFRGYGVDYEGGMIDPTNLQWATEKSGYGSGCYPSCPPVLLGTGSDITAHLSAGDHNIILNATDSLGLVAVDTIDLQVKHSGSGVPSARILSPADGSEFAPTDIITFKGEIFDPEDGKLAGGWYSDRDGYLGSGDEIHVQLTMEGFEGPTVHTIRYTATDNDGNTDTDHITVIIVARH